MKKQPTITLHIKKWGINGEGIAFYKRKPVFVENAIPGETVEARITEEKDGYLKAAVAKVITPSARRREPLCMYASQCGGCALGHVQSKEQSRMKEKVLKEALKKYAGYTGPVEPIIKNLSPLGYRNALKLPLRMEDGKIAAGMYAAGSQDFVSVQRCLIHAKGLEAAKQAVVDVLNQFHAQAYDYKTDSGYYSLIMRQLQDKIQVTLVTSDLQIPEAMVKALLQIDNVDSLWQSIRSKDEKETDVFGTRMVHLGGEENLHLELNGFTLSLLPRSFFQLNTWQALRIYELVAQWVPECNVLVEAYAGIGAMSLFAAKKAREVIGIENIPDAVANANENARINHLDNVRFICADAGEELQKLEKEMDIDVLIVDPPRSGLDSAMIQAILDSHIQTIIYVSCNPSTLGKNIHDLQPAYKIEKVQPVDIFSQTPHVESVIQLSRV